MLLFDTEVREATKFYNVTNILVFLLSVVGSFGLAYNYSGLFLFDGNYDQFSHTTFWPVFFGLSVSSFLLYLVIRILIQSYGEKVRSNLYKDFILNKL